MAGLGRRRYYPKWTTASAVCLLVTFLILNTAASLFPSFDDLWDILRDVWFASLGFIVVVIALRTSRTRSTVRKRIKKGLCLSCGYSLIGNTSGVCPECGTRV
jgi:hypothetical protein